MTAPDKTQAILPVTPELRLDGYNGAISQAIRALRYLAENDRPSEGERFPNSACCYLVAEELERTMRNFEPAITAWNTRISHSLPGEERPADWRNTIIHPNNRLLFRRMAEVAGIDIGTDDIATALRKVAALTPSALSGDAGENYRDCVEAALAPARQWWGGGKHGNDHIYLINNMMADLRVFHAPKAPPADPVGVERLSEAEHLLRYARTLVGVARSSPQPVADNARLIGQRIDAYFAALPSHQGAE